MKSNGKPRQQPEYVGYLYAHFKRESADGEQIYFALSDGNDPLHFDDLNGGKPVLYSTLGERGVRDPHVVRSPEGDRFYLVATDLRLYASLDWDRHQRRGSRSIMVWESADLVNWGEGRLVEVAPAEAGNTWAPEAVWDPEQEAYLVHWSSTLYDNAGHEGESYNRIMYAITRDFREFSEPGVWIDRGWHTIDTTVIDHAGVYYRFLKDERGRSGDAPFGKSVFCETSTSLTAAGWSRWPKASAWARSAKARGRWCTSRTPRTSGISGSTSSHRNDVTSPSRRPTSPAVSGSPPRTTACPRIPVTASCYR